MIAERDACDAKCVKTYNSFEKKCLGKSDELKDIYKTTAKLVEAKKKCYTSWCAEFPTIHVMSNKKDMTKERKKRCEDYCDKDKIEMRCQKKFQLEIDFVMAGIKSECAEESGIGECFARRSSNWKLISSWRASSPSAPRRVASGNASPRGRKRSTRSRNPAKRKRTPPARRHMTSARRRPTAKPARPRRFA